MGSCLQCGQTYDIICQFIKKLRDHWLHHFPEHVPLIDCLIATIPKKHLVGHCENCKVCYSCNFSPGFGWVYGEGIEAVWAEDNQQRSSLHEMNAGHRHDVTDDNHMDWNSRKNQRMGMSQWRFITNLTVVFH